MRQINDLYKVQKGDISKGGAVLADAFQNDPIWKEVLKEFSFKQRSAFFEGAVRYCLKFGCVYAPSDRLEGIAAWIPSHYADMTAWRMLRSWSIISGMKMGIKMGMKIRPIFEPLETDRKENMKGRRYIYLMIIGIASEYQGQGFGKKMLTALFEESEQEKVPVYLETATERNIKMYEKYGFRQIRKTILPIINLPQWEMVREPRTNQG